jgi:anti-anti-sigma regulatory factor
MLRISVQNDPETTRLKLEGKLAHEWVYEAEKAWTALLAIEQKAKVIVDLQSVSFVDDPGCQLLAEMRHAGAELVGSGPLMAAVIEEIEGAEVARSERRAEQTGQNYIKMERS